MAAKRPRLGVDASLELAELEKLRTKYDNAVKEHEDAVAALDKCKEAYEKGTEDRFDLWRAEDGVKEAKRCVLEAEQRLKDTERASYWKECAATAFLGHGHDNTHLIHLPYYDHLLERMKSKLVGGAKHLLLSGSPGTGKSTVLEVLARAAFGRDCGGIDTGSLAGVLSNVSAVVVVGERVHLAMIGRFYVTACRNAVEAVDDVAETLLNAKLHKPILILQDSSAAANVAYVSRVLGSVDSGALFVFASSNDPRQYKDFAKGDGLDIYYVSPLSETFVRDNEKAILSGLDEGAAASATSSTTISIDERWRLAGGVLRHLRQAPEVVKAAVAQALKQLQSPDINAMPRVPYLFVEHATADGSAIERTYYASEYSMQEFMGWCIGASLGNAARTLEYAANKYTGDVLGRFFEAYGIERLAHGGEFTLHRQQAPKLNVLKLRRSTKAICHGLEGLLPSQRYCTLVVPYNPNFPLLDALYIDDTGSSITVYMIQLTVATSHEPKVGQVAAAQGLITQALQQWGALGSGQVQWVLLWVGLDGQRGVTKPQNNVPAAVRQYSMFLNTGKTFNVTRIQANGSKTQYMLETSLSLGLPPRLGQADKNTLLQLLKDQHFPSGTYKIHNLSITI